MSLLNQNRVRFAVQSVALGAALVCARQQTRQFPLHPYSGRKERMKGSYPARMPVYGIGFRGRDPGL